MRSGVAASERGFALLLVVVLVMVCGVMLSGFAGRSGGEALVARDRVEDLQRRWASISLREALLPSVEALLREAEGRADEGAEGDVANSPSRSVLGGTRLAGGAVGELRVVVSLGGLAHELVLTDEQARVRVDRLLSDRGRLAAEAEVARLLGGRRLGMRVSLSPVVMAAGGEPEVSGYGQVFAAVLPERLVGSGVGDGVAGGGVTCWGDGRLNVQRADEAAIQLVCEGLLGEAGVQALLAGRDRDAFASLEELLRGVGGMHPLLRGELEGVLTDRSGCHGVWVVSRGRQRDWVTLSVARRGEDGGLLGRVDFAW